MRHLARFAFLAAFPLLAAPSIAQHVHVYGKVVRHGQQFSIDCTNVLLQSSTITLQEFKDDDVGIYGYNVGTLSNPIINVTSIHESEDVLELDGMPKLGKDIELKLESDNGIYYAFFYASGPGFLPLEYIPGVSGALLLDLNSTFIFASGFFEEEVEYEIPVPNDPSLVGVKFWIQAAILTSPTTAAYLNVVCGTVKDD